MFSRAEALSSRLQSALDTLADISPELEQTVSTAVRALQFEDMSSQALATASRSLAHVRELSTELDQAVAVDGMEESLRSRRQEWGRTRHRPVSQTTVEEGEVELF
jgi:methyl-accepting chemotaxis protein